MSVFDAIGDRLVGLDLHPFDPVAEEVIAVRVAARDYETRSADAPASVAYDGFLLSLTFEQSLAAPGALAGRSVGGRGAIRVGDPSRDDAPSGTKLEAWAGWRWQGRRFEAWLLEAGRPFADRVVVISGLLGALSRDGNDWVLPIRDLQERLRGDLQDPARSYLGTGGFEGGPELAGKPRPAGFGLNRRIEPVPLGEDLWFDLHDGEIEEIIDGEVQVGGSAIVEDPSNPPASGKHYRDLANGRLRLGTRPSLPLTVSFRGDASGSGYVSTMASIARRILGRRGGVDDPAGLVTASFEALDAANPAEVGFWAGTDKVSIAAALDAVLGSDLAFWLPDALSRFRVGRLALPTATEETADLALDEHDIVRGSVRRRLVDTPPWMVRGLYRPYGRTLTTSELAGAVSAANGADYGQEFRVKTWSDADVLAAWPDSKPLDLEMRFDDAAAAQAATDRAGAILGVGLVPYELETGLQPLGIDLGGQIWVRYPDEGLAEGKALILASRSVDLVQGFTRCELWGVG